MNTTRRMKSISHFVRHYGMGPCKVGELVRPRDKAAPDFVGMDLAEIEYRIAAWLEDTKNETPN